MYIMSQLCALKIFEISISNERVLIVSTNKSTKRYYNFSLYFMSHQYDPTNTRLCILQCNNSWLITVYKWLINKNNHAILI